MPIGAPVLGQEYVPAEMESIAGAAGTMGQMKCFPVRKATDQDGVIWLVGGGTDPA